MEAAIAAGIPRLAFIGAAAWLDAASGLYNAPQVRFELEQRIRKFAKAYAPAYARHARKLAKGVRHAQLHEYKTQSVALTHNDPEQHLRFSVNGELILNVNSLAADLDRAFKGFWSDLLQDVTLRARVLPYTRGLIAPRLLTAHPGVQIPAASATNGARQ